MRYRKRKAVEALHEPLRQRLLRQAPKPDTEPVMQFWRMLPPRQAEIVGLIARGLTYEQVGVSLGISIKTVQVRLCDMRKTARTIKAIYEP